MDKTLEIYDHAVLTLSKVLNELYCVKRSLKDAKLADLIQQAQYSIRKAQDEIQDESLRYRIGHKD